MADITKDDIKREHLTNSMLKRVLMRADFTPMLDLESTVSSMNKQQMPRGRVSGTLKVLVTSLGQ